VANFVADVQLFKSHVNTFQLTTSLPKAQKNIFTALTFVLQQHFNILYCRKHWPAHCTAFTEFRFLKFAVTFPLDTEGVINKFIWNSLQYSRGYGEKGKREQTGRGQVLKESERKNKKVIVTET